MLYAGSLITFISSLRFIFPPQRKRITFKSSIWAFTGWPWVTLCIIRSYIVGWTRSEYHFSDVSKWSFWNKSIHITDDICTKILIIIIFYIGKYYVSTENVTHIKFYQKELLRRCYIQRIWELGNIHFLKWLIINAIDLNFLTKVTISLWLLHF